MATTENAAIEKQLATRESPADRSLTFADVIQSVVNQAQFDVLRGKTPAHAIREREAGRGQSVKYVPHGYVRDQLNKAFGFDWDFEILSAFDGQPFNLATRDETDAKGRAKTVQHLTVLGRLTIRIRDPQNIGHVLSTIVKTEFGSQAWREKMEMGDALKAASSDALKRCGLGLGIALDLYYDEDASVQRWETAQSILNGNGHEPKEPTSLVELLTAVNKLGIDANTLCEKLGVASVADIKDFAGAWEIIQKNGS